MENFTTWDVIDEENHKYVCGCCGEEFQSDISLSHIRLGFKQCMYCLLYCGIGGMICSKK